MKTKNIKENEAIIFCIEESNRNVYIDLEGKG
jgi:general stress protein 26